MRAEAKMVEIPTSSVVECGAWSVEAGGASNMQPPFLISHFIFFILYFSFLILDSRGSAPSGRHHRPRDWGIAGKAVSAPIVVAPTSRTSLPRSRAGCTRPRTVGLSNCRVSDAKHLKALNLKSYQASSLCLNSAWKRLFLYDMPLIKKRSAPERLANKMITNIYKYLIRIK